jgi:two-component system sensor histidine kinase PilS (NtrC family)
MHALQRLSAGSDDWRVLRALTLYRLLLITLLLSLLESGFTLTLFEKVDAGLFRSINRAYALASLLLLVPLLSRRPRATLQMGLQFGIDALSLTALVYATGGIESGLGILLITPMVAAALVLSPRLAMVCAASGTLLIFGEEFLRQLAQPVSPADLTSTGVLGLMFFATTMAAAAVAARARKSEALAASADREVENLSRLNENIVEALQTGVIVINADRRVRTVNQAALRLLGVNQAVDRSLVDLAPALAHALQDWLLGSAAASRPVVARPGGAEVTPRFSRLGWFESSPLLILLDDTEQLREQARQLKLASLGRLSASIAHEIRNPLSAMTHAGQLLAEDPELRQDQRRLLDMIARHGSRIDQIVRDVLDLARRSPQPAAAIVLGEALQRIRSVYLETPGHSERVIDLPSVPEDWRVRFDADHLLQVLHNLWDNSFEHAERPDVVVRLQASMEDGQLRLDIRDNGIGIAEGVRERLFEPFTTTSARGTGLGLYLARELCELNQAQLRQIPQAAGAHFRILFSSAG